LTKKPFRTIQEPLERSRKAAQKEVGDLFEYRIRHAIMLRKMPTTFTEIFMGIESPHYDFESNDFFAISKRESISGTSYQVLDEDTWTPYWVERSKVTFQDFGIPNNWVKIRRNGETLFTFPEFSKEGFWEDFFDGEKKAIDAYNSIIVPISCISIKCSHIDDIHKFTWSNVSVLLQNKWCLLNTPVDLAIKKVSEESYSQEELLLAGLRTDEEVEIKNLVSSLAANDSLDEDQLIKVGSNWVKDCYPNADLDLFVFRLKKSF